MDIDEVKELLEEDIALVMLTNPNTLGLFEVGLRYQVCGS